MTRFLERTQPIDDPRFHDIPTQLIPLLSEDLKSSTEHNKVVSISPETYRMFDDLIRDLPNLSTWSLERLKAFIYLTIGSISGGYYPETDMEAFKRKVRDSGYGTVPDCARVAQSLEESFLRAGLQAQLVRCVCRGREELIRLAQENRDFNEYQRLLAGEIQFTCVVDAHPGQRAFAIDGAGWYYEPQIGTDRWLHIEEGRTPQEASDNLVTHFQRNSVVGSGINPEDWKALDIISI